MFNKKEKKEELNVENLNDVVSLSKKILKIVYILVLFIGVYLLIKLTKELKILPIIFSILKRITPLFIGLFIAWLFDPFVKWLSKKKIKRGLGTLITYIIIIGVIGIIIGSIVPILSDQLNEIVKIVPTVFDNIKGWINDIFNNLKNIDNFDADAVKIQMFDKIESLGTDLTESLPSMLVSFVSSFFSGIGTFIVGLVIGFYLLMSFDNASGLMLTWLPKNWQEDTKELFGELDLTLRRFIKGALLDSFVVFVVTSIGFSIIGLRAPLLFGLFCGITNIIPYAGPYIGGIPAALVGFSMSPLTGILTIIVLVIIQTLEGNFLQPVIMSKSTKLHPVTIILGLLIFGYFFGILGMAVATPVISCLKTIFTFFVEKYNLLSYKN